MKKFLIISISAIILLLIILICINISKQNNMTNFNNSINEFINHIQLDEINRTNEDYRTAAKFIIATLNQAIILETVLSEKDLENLNSQQITDFISESLIIENKISENKIKLNNGMFIETKCLFNKCKFIIDMNGNDLPNKKWKNHNVPFDIIELEIKKDKIAFKQNETKSKERDIYIYKALPIKFMKCYNNNTQNCN